MQKYFNSDTKQKKQNINHSFLRGYTMVEVLVVLAIMSVLLVTAGLSYYAYSRNAYLLDQVAQELAGEIRLTKSQILSIQDIESGAGVFVPKAAVIEITNSGTSPQISYLKSVNSTTPCVGASLESSETFSLGNRATVKSITDSSNGSYTALYLVYTSPTGKFYATDSNPDGNFVNSINQSCKPQDLLNSSIETFTVTLKSSDDKRDERIQINGQTGEVTILKN